MEIPDGFQQVTSHVPGVIVYAPKQAPTDAVAAGAELVSPCSACGYQMHYAKGADVLRCPACQHEEAVVASSPSVPAATAAPAEFRVKVLEKIAETADDRVEVHCGGCGARVVVEHGHAVGACSFCGAQTLDKQKAAAQIVQPTLVLPFGIDERSARDAVGAWLMEGRYPPKDVADAVATLKLSAVYMPFWVFDANVEAKWQCSIGRYETTGSGDNRQRRLIWHPCGGREETALDNDLERAFGDYQPHAVDRLYPFALAKAQPFEPRYLAGVQVHSTEAGLPVGFARARKRWREAAHGGALAKVSHEKHVANFQSDIRYAEETWQLALLPVYVASLTYNGASYEVFVQGEDGRVAGERPASKMKVLVKEAPALAIGAAFAIVGWRAKTEYSWLPFYFGMAMFLWVLRYVALQMRLVADGRERDDIMRVKPSEYQAVFIEIVKAGGKRLAVGLISGFIALSSASPGFGIVAIILLSLAGYSMYQKWWSRTRWEALS